MGEVTDSPAETARIDAIMNEHWMRVDSEDRITGCQCGFRANMAEYDYGDGVLRHVLGVALQLPDPVSPVDSPALDLDAVRERVLGFEEHRYSDPFYARASAGDVPALLAEVERLRQEMIRRDDAMRDRMRDSLREIERLRADRDRLAAELDTERETSARYAAQSREASNRCARLAAQVQTVEAVVAPFLVGEDETADLVRAALAVPAATEEATTDE